MASCLAAPLSAPPCSFCRRGYELVWMAFHLPSSQCWTAVKMHELHCINKSLTDSWRKHPITAYSWYKAPCPADLMLGKLAAGWCAQSGAEEPNSVRRMHCSAACRVAVMETACKHRVPYLTPRRWQFCNVPFHSECWRWEWRQWRWMRRLSFLWL